MTTSTLTQASPARVRKRSWFEAYRMFLRNPKEMLGLKLLPLVALGWVPISMADDFLLPLIGLADDIPTTLFVGFVIVRTWWRVRTYR